MIMTVLSRILEPSVAVETPPVDAAAVLEAVADAFFLGPQSTGRAKREMKKRTNERTRIHGSCIIEEV